MFSAYNSTDHFSTKSRSPSETAIKRLDGIGEVLSALDLAAIRTQSDMTRARYTLDIAEQCIRAVLSEFRTETASEQVAHKSEDLIDMIEHARDELLGSRGKSLS
jgi:hypothetical protein